MKNSQFRNLKFRVVFLALLFFINFTFTACDENKDLTTESVDRTSGYIIKADLNELTSKIGDRDLKLIELIKNNPVSKLKTTLLQKTTMVSSEFYFDTDNIISLKNDTNQAVYIIPAYKSSNVRDNNIYSISINITDDFIDTKLNIVQLKEDGTQEFISRNFEYSKTNSKTSKTKDMECYCTIFITGGVSQGTGWYFPESTAMVCSSCSGGGFDFGMGSGPNTGGTITLATVWANSGGSSYGYVYNYTGDIVYAKLTNIITQSFNKFAFTPLQQHNIKESFEISNVLHEFLKTDGVTQNNLDFVVSNIDAIEDGTVTNYEQSLVLLNAYKQAQEFLAFKNQFFIDNPTATEAHFENWFMGDNPKKDGEEEITPDLITFDSPTIIEALPPFNDFVSAFPKEGTAGNYTQMSADKVYNLVEGTLLNSYINEPNKYSNACSIRGSRGLLYSNISIPILIYNGLQRTQKGGDNKNYILDAVSFNTFMKVKFDEAKYALTGADANDPNKVAAFLKGKNGIYVIINNDPKKFDLGGAGYSGHVDTIINGICIGKAYTRPQGGVKSIKIWTLN